MLVAGAAIIATMTALAGLIRLNFSGHLNSLQQTSNTIHISDDGAGSAPDFTELLAVATQAAAQFSTSYRSVAVTSWTFDTITAKQVVPPGDTTVPLEATYSVNLAGTRTVSGDDLPESLCACLAFKTPNASRRFRGHVLLPPAMDSSAFAGNNLDTGSTYWTNCEAFATELAKGTPGGAGWTGSALSAYQLVIYSATAQGLSLPSVANVQTLVLRQKASWLRRREQGAT